MGESALMVGSEKGSALGAFKNRDMQKIQNEQGVNLGWDNEEYKINYEKMMETIQFNHPQNKNGEFYSFKEIIKDSPTGDHSCCCGTTKETEFD